MREFILIIKRMQKKEIKAFCKRRRSEKAEQSQVYMYDCNSDVYYRTGMNMSRSINGA